MHGWQHTETEQQSGACNRSENELHGAIPACRMNINVDQKLWPELMRDERFRWSALTQTGLRWRSNDWFAAPFTLFWCQMVFGMA